jgi:tetratricopeptide (TPR) repeat protein
MHCLDGFTRLVCPRFLLTLFCTLLTFLPVRGQNQRDANGQNIFRGNSAELRVTLRDARGQIIAASATVKLYRMGVLANQQITNNGHASFILPVLGDYTVAASAAGFKPEQRDVSVQVAVESEIDINMVRDSTLPEGAPTAGRPVLAPKAQEAFNKGLEALGQNNMKEAEKQIGEAARLAPGHPDVLYAQGVLYLRERKWPEAREVLEKATQVDPNHSQAFSALGMTYVNEGKYDAAIPALETAARLEPANWETQWTLGEAYYRHEQYNEALKNAQEALAKSNGKAPEIELLVAESLVAVSRYEDAGQVLRQYVKNHGNRPDVAKAKKWLDRLKADGKIKG